MLKMMKFLKKYWLAVVAVIVLLVAQAQADLKLPEYTSNIVDVGIAQGGIESAAPSLIRAEEMDLLCLFFTEEEEKEVLSSYIKEEIDGVSYYRKKEEAQTDLAEIFIPAEMLLYTAKQQGMELDARVLSKEMCQTMLESANAQMAAMPDSVKEQMALSYVKAEYEACGLDLEELQMSYLFESGWKMLGMALLIMLAMILVGFLSSWISAGVARDLRQAIFEKVVSFSNREMDRFSTASLITRSTNDIQQVQMVIMMLLRMVFYAPLLGIGGFVKVMRTTPSMAWIIGVAVLAIVCLVAVLMAIAMPKFHRMQSLVDRLNLVAREILTGLPVIRVFSRERYEEKRFEQANRELTNNSLFTSRVMSTMMPLMTLLMNGVTVLIVWVGGNGIDAGHLQVGDMMAFITYTMQIVMSFLMLTMMSIMLPRAIVAAKRIDEVLTTPLSIQDTEAAKLPEESKGVLEFDHVTFTYPGAKESALEDLTFTAKPGETTAIIGSTGCGKSTLIRLIPRFYDVTEGAIRLDGVDIREIKQKDLRKALGYVPQKGVLFSGTIADNLAFGCENASMEECRQAARIAQAESFIEEKAEGYESLIAQGGTNVSGGQKQRLSIARAIAKRPKIYLFDDSFSALDYKTDTVLRKALKEEVSDSTVIIVAQRISTILHAEQILVLEEGKIVGRGTHEELMKTCEAYRQIARSQLSQTELEGKEA